MYSFDNVDALSLDVWGPDHVLQPLPQAHLIVKKSKISSNKRASKKLLGVVDQKEDATPAHFVFRWRWSS
jgi:hypothetical protein